MAGSTHGALLVATGALALAALLLFASFDPGPLVPASAGEPEESVPTDARAAWAYTYLGAPASAARAWRLEGGDLAFFAPSAGGEAGGEILRDDLPLARGHRVSFTLSSTLEGRGEVVHVIARDAKGREDAIEIEAREARLVAGGRVAARAPIPTAPLDVAVARDAAGRIEAVVGGSVLVANGSVEVPLAVGFRAIAEPGAGRAVVRALAIDASPDERFPAREYLPAPGRPVLLPPTGFDWIGTPSLVAVGDAWRLYVRAHSEADDTGTVVLRYDSRNLAAWRFAGVAFTRETLGVHGLEDPAVVVDGDRLVCVISGAKNGGWDVHALASPVHREAWTHLGVALARGPPGSDDDWEAKKPSLLNWSGTWHLWYDLRNRAGEQRGLGLATGPDVMSLEKRAVATNVWGSPEVREDGAGGLVMLYDKGLAPSRSDGIFLATSTDGVEWTEEGRVIAPGAPGTHRELAIFPTWIDAPGARLVLYEGKHRDDDPRERTEVDRHFGVVEAAARFDGFFEGVATEVDARGEPFAYRAWPLGKRAVPGLAVDADEGAVVLVERAGDRIAVRAIEGEVRSAAVDGVPVDVLA